MTDTTTPTPPDSSVWWDAAATAAAALDVLRLTDVDVDADRIAALVPVAGQAINDRLDRPAEEPLGMPAPPVLADAIVQVVVELYRRKDAPPSSVDGMLASAWRPPSLDAVSGVMSLIRPYKARVGIG